MHIILGGTGHIGSALAQLLCDRGEPVTVVMHDERKRPGWEAKGVEVAVLDVHDVSALRAVFETGTRAFLLNPPAPPSSDTVREERVSVRCILAALHGMRLDLLVAESTYGAQPGDALGDLGVLYAFEQALRAQPIATAIMRGAYYMSNWDTALETARSEGKVHSLYPADFSLPMVAPADIAGLAAELMLAPARSSGPHHIEGPARYSSADVARAFSDALGRPVVVETTPPEKWGETLRAQGFSRAAAESMANMTRVTIAQADAFPREVLRGPTTLAQYVTDLVQHRDTAQSAPGSRVEH